MRPCATVQSPLATRQQTYCGRQCWSLDRLLWRRTAEVYHGRQSSTPLMRSCGPTDSWADAATLMKVSGWSVLAVAVEMHAVALSAPCHPEEAGKPNFQLSRDRSRAMVAYALWIIASIAVVADIRARQAICIVTLHNFSLAVENAARGDCRENERKVILDARRNLLAHAEVRSFKKNGARRTRRP